MASVGTVASRWTLKPEVNPVQIIGIDSPTLTKERDQVKAELDTLADERRREAALAKTQQTELEKSVAALTGQVAIWKAAAEKNPGQAETLKAAQAAAKLQAQIDQADTAKLQEVEVAFVAARGRYVSLQNERDEWVRIDRPKPANATLERKNESLAAAENQLRAALAKLDTAYQKVHASHQSAVTAAQAALKVARDRFEEDSPAVKDRKAELAKAEAAQTPFADAAARALGTGKALAITEIVALSPAVGVFDLSNRKPGDAWIVTVKGIETHWRWIPAGPFKVGSPASEKGRHSDEAGANGSPVEVTISRGFWMLETEVTQELWTAVMGTTIEQQKSKASATSLYGTGAKHPMYYVSHDEATEFCEKFNALLKLQPDATGLAVRLPTEAEWEYAARAGTTTRYYWGDRDEDADQYAWHAGNSAGGTHPVGQKKPNAWGLCDMSGSVWEWCSDWYVDKLPGGSDPRRPATAPGVSFRVDRGGSWRSSVGIGYLRSAFRYGYSPGNRIYDFGFRLACSSVKG